MSAGEFTAWAAWHPKHEGALAFADLDACASHVRDLNQDAGTNHRNGWRAVKVSFVRVTI